MKTQSLTYRTHRRFLTYTSALTLGFGLMAMPLLHAEAPPTSKKVTAPSSRPHATVVVEKSSQTVKDTASLPFKTGESGIYVANTPGSAEKLAAANGNVYALAINTQGVTRAMGVVHVNGRTLLVADPARYKEKLAKAKSAAPIAVATADTTAR
ncbi:MAG: hypothetical protein B9S32_17245 [Verrucomicrobia bacterium Tous-C9LFEB]|nr:MAG: hypothetical protein B9S32_17245 [Verrucomicrobia bacterium Tous-C9LFEB]